MNYPTILQIPGFLQPSICRQIQTAMDRGCPEPAEVLGAEIRLDAAVRRAEHVEVDAATLTMIGERLDALRPRLEQTFATSLGEREGTSFLRYVTGGRFSPHRDHGYVSSWPDAARRRVSIVLFLAGSRTVDPSGSFSGGMLRLFSEQGAATEDVQPQTGLLVAFPSATLHEVTPVTDGVRDVIVDWFYDGQPNRVSA